ncbi:MAG: hypothetical protein ACSLFN_02150 [Candidatus Limnocylindrales bacterium]
MCHHSLSDELTLILKSPGGRAIVPATGADFPELGPASAAVRLLLAAESMPDEFGPILRMIAGDLAASGTWDAPIGYRARAGDKAAIAEFEAFFPEELAEIGECEDDHDGGGTLARRSRPH